MFYFLKINLVPKVVTRDEPGIKMSKKNNARFPSYCYLLVTGDTAGAQTMPQTCMSLMKMDAIVWLSRACYLLTSVSHNAKVLKRTGLGEVLFERWHVYKLILNLYHSDGAFAL